MKYTSIKKHCFLLINLIIILLTIINLYNLLMKYNYTAILFFFIVSFVVYYFNKNLAIILGIPLFLTNIINSFTNLFKIKLIEGFTSDDVNNLKTKLDDYYIKIIEMNSILKNNSEFQKNNTEKQGVDNAVKLLIKIINDKTYSSNRTIMNDANFLFTSLNLLDIAIQKKQSSKIATLNIDIINSYSKIISEMNKPKSNGYTAAQVTELKTKFDGYYIKIIAMNSILKNSSEFQKNNNEKQKIDNALNLLITIIKNKTLTSNTTIMNDANNLYGQLNLLYIAYESKQSSLKILGLKNIIFNSVLKIDNDIKNIKPSNPQPPKPAPVPPQPPPKPKPINPICDNIMDTKLCCDTRPKYEWNELTGICKTK